MGRIGTLLLSAFFCSHISPVLSADTVQLSAAPDKCISLLKGQTCFQRVQFRWKSQNIPDVQELICLWREGDAVALTCWEKESEGVYRYSLEATESTNFYLAAGKQQQPIVARTTVKVSWVYNNRKTRRSRWKLF